MGRRKMDSELHRIKLETGTVYQTSKGGNYYFRYQINGERKCVSLKTANQEEAIRKARELLPIVQATNPEVIATHVKIARKMASRYSCSVAKIFRRRTIFRLCVETEICVCRRCSANLITCASVICENILILGPRKRRNSSSVAS